MRGMMVVIVVLVVLLFVVARRVRQGLGRAPPPHAVAVTLTGPVGQLLAALPARPCVARLGCV